MKIFVQGFYSQDKSSPLLKKGNLLFSFTGWIGILLCEDTLLLGAFVLTERCPALGEARGL